PFLTSIHRTATTAPYTPSLHDALPISTRTVAPAARRAATFLVATGPPPTTSAAIDSPCNMTGYRLTGSGPARRPPVALRDRGRRDRKSTRLNSSHVKISYAVFCLKKKK